MCPARAHLGQQQPPPRQKGKAVKALRHLEVQVQVKASVQGFRCQVEVRSLLELASELQRLQGLRAQQRELQRGRQVQDRRPRVTLLTRRLDRWQRRLKQWPLR